MVCCVVDLLMCVLSCLRLFGVKTCGLFACDQNVCVTSFPTRKLRTSSENEVKTKRFSCSWRKKSTTHTISCSCSCALTPSQTSDLQLYSLSFVKIKGKIRCFAVVVLLPLLLLLFCHRFSGRLLAPSPPNAQLTLGLQQPHE